MNRPSLTETRSVACVLLRETIDQWERHARKTTLNEYEVRRLLGAIRIVGDRRLQERAEALIPYAPRFDAVNEVNLPTLSLEELLASVVQSARHKETLRLCLEGKVEAALQLAKSPFDVEEAALTLAVLGDFSSAMRIADDDPRLEASRRQSIMDVVLIEAYRRNLRDWIGLVWDRVDRDRLNGLDVALGLLGHRPWDGYPYPDW